jgi:hypothetical protein
MYSPVLAERIRQIQAGPKLGINMYQDKASTLCNTSICSVLSIFVIPLRALSSSSNYSFKHPGSVEAIPNRLPRVLPLQDPQRLASNYGMLAFSPNYV